jgi:hypothetical protein
MSNIDDNRKWVFRRGHIPYRGEVWPRYPKPRQQARDLAEERMEYLFTAVVIFIFSAMVLGFGIWLFTGDHDGYTLFVFFAISAAIFTAGLAALNGMRSINKFRENYDLDISGLPQEEEQAEKKPYIHHKRANATERLIREE